MEAADDLAVRPVRRVNRRLVRFRALLGSDLETVVKPPRRARVLAPETLSETCIHILDGRFEVFAWNYLVFDRLRGLSITPPC